MNHVPFPTVWQQYCRTEPLLFLLLLSIEFSSSKSNRRSFLEQQDGSGCHGSDDKTSRLEHHGRTRLFGSRGSAELGTHGSTLSSKGTVSGRCILSRCSQSTHTLPTNFETGIASHTDYVSCQSIANGEEWIFSVSNA